MSAATHIRQFDFDAATREFTAEISSTNGLRQIWNDSADLGLTVTNPDTGRSVTFVVTDETFDHEGDQVSWILKSVTGTREDGRFSMVLFND
jgi:hypothetical protein